MRQFCITGCAVLVFPHGFVVWLFCAQAAKKNETALRIATVRVIIHLSIIEVSLPEETAMKKIIAMLLALALLAACSVFVFADEEEEVFTSSCYRFKAINDEEASIVGFFGPGHDLHLSSSVGHRYITSVGTSAFEFNTELVNVRLSSRVKEIGDYAFHGCTELMYITIPDSVQSIGRNAFQSCNDLEKIAIPEGITELKDATFQFCPGLKSVNLPSTLEKISPKAFQFCTSLESLAIPASVSEIGEDAFKDCPRLTLSVAEGSYAEQYAQEAGIPFTTE